MKPENTTFELANQNLAHACQNCQSSCCKKGLLFMLPEEVGQVKRWIVANKPEVMERFVSLLQNHGDFWLFDQEEACMFLDAKDLCQLHMSGAKPKECYIWPLHIYLSNLGQPEIKVSTTCCDGYKFISQDHPSMEATRNFARDIGYSRLARFRSIYAGSYGSKLIEFLDLKENTNTLKLSELPCYRTAGERFFPEEDWDSGLKRVERMLCRYPDGIIVFKEENEILGYATLWPITNEAARSLETGELLDCHIDEKVIPEDPKLISGNWIITAIGVIPEQKEKRREIILSLLNAIRSRLAPDKRHSVYAHAATESGERFLRRTGFEFSFPSAEKLCRWMIS